MFKLAITGSADIEKSNNLTEYSKDTEYTNEVYQIVYKELDLMVKDVMKTKKVEAKDLVFISGMARGVDEIFAIYAMNNNIPLILSIPNSIDWHKNKASRRKGSNVKAQAERYDDILNYVQERINAGCKYSKIYEIRKDYISTSPHDIDPFDYAYSARNQHMIDISDAMMSYFKIFTSGTNHAIQSALRDEKYLGNVNGYSGLKNLLAPLKIMYDTDLIKEHSHILIQGCNCFNTMGAGIAKILRNLYPEVYEVDCDTKKGDRDKLGTFSYVNVNPLKTKGQLSYVVNAYTQYTYNNKNDMFYNEAFYKSITSAIDMFIDKRGKSKAKLIFSLPAIGLGLANGKIEEVYEMLNNISDKYIDDNIEIKLCLIGFDKELNKEFKNLEKEKFFLGKKKAKKPINKIKR